MGKSTINGNFQELFVCLPEGKQYNRHLALTRPPSSPSSGCYHGFRACKDYLLTAHYLLTAPLRTVNIYIYAVYVYTYIYIYMWQGPFGIMRPSSLSPHIVLLFFLWLLSLSLFLFLFLFFFSLSLSLALFLAVLFSACIFGHTILFVSHLCPYLSPLFSPICILNSLTIAILLISSLRLLSVLVS